MNDFWDREFDKHVERTKSRPLAAKELTRPEAMAFAVSHALLGMTTFHLFDKQLYLQSNAPQLWIWLLWLSLSFGKTVYILSASSPRLVYEFGSCHIKLRNHRTDQPIGLAVLRHRCFLDDDI